MKLLFYAKQGIPHKKNWDAIQRMTSECGIDFEYTNDIERIKNPNYEILFSMSDFVDPNIIPYSVKALYGPHLWVIPTPPMVGSSREELNGKCAFNLLSKWVKEYALEMASEYIMPIVHFPFSVDTNKFKPSETVNKELDCIVYIKRRSNIIIDYTINLLKEKGINHIIFKYGSYQEQDYKNALHKSKFMLCLDAHESQGFALEEAMSCGVPLLVMDATSMHDESDNGVTFTYEYLKPKQLLATSVPYWSDECGIKITDKEQLSEAIDSMIQISSSFTPRDFILRTLSDKVCMKRILDYFGLQSED